ncbi:hypothetical protein [Actinomadura oligospora]|uniref:hypothetical protein n=1 Tax=Actinomadura oligospora TaxID=111804 RepID=UPI0004788D1A|nr:hypothetical protein [Actinomadura oligospora]
MTLTNFKIAGRSCVQVGGAPAGKTRLTITVRVDRTHRVYVMLDGVRYGSQMWTLGVLQAVELDPKTGKIVKKRPLDSTLYVDVPSDALPHQIGLKAVDGATTGDTALYSADCIGGVKGTVKSYSVDPASMERHYQVQLAHTGTPAVNLSAYVWLDGRQVGGPITLKPGQAVTRDVVVPADAKLHVISTGYRNRKQLISPTMWHALTAETAPVIDKPGWTPVTTFKAGETVVITSAVGEAPLATDGSEWMLLEYSKAGTSTWVPLGDAETDGLVAPDDDGTWSYQLDTSKAPFASGGSWDIRATRYQDYRASDQVVHSFAISGTLTPPTSPFTAPRITAPTNHTARSGQRVTLRGTGPAGARLEFRRRLVTKWGEAGPVPAPCTVGKDGKWSTWVIAEKVGSHSYKKIAYSCRASRNGRTTAWSNELTIRWNKRR